MGPLSIPSGPHATGARRKPEQQTPVGRGRSNRLFLLQALPVKTRIAGAEEGWIAERAVSGEAPGVSIAELPIQIDREKVADFCRARGIRKLSLFGSVLRDDFDPRRSDVDVLVDFEPGALNGVGLRYFGYGEELAEILGLKVDFCSRLSKYIEADVRREALPIYEQA